MVKQYFYKYVYEDHTIRYYCIDPSQYNAEPKFLEGYPFFNGARGEHYRIRNLPRYPESEKYLLYDPYDLPFMISKGLDPFIYTCRRDRKQKKIQRQFWFLEFEDHVWRHGEGVQFVKITSALAYAKRSYRAYLENNMDKLQYFAQ